MGFPWVDNQTGEPLPVNKQSTNHLCMKNKKTHSMNKMTH